jgi:hypothetical protein
VASRDERLAENQHTFRRANERFEELVDDRSDGYKVPFVCECADESCLGRIEMSVSDYYAIHLDRSQYVILDDHLTITGERLVEQIDGFQIVSKGLTGKQWSS